MAQPPVTPHYLNLRGVATRKLKPSHRSQPGQTGGLLNASLNGWGIQVGISGDGQPMYARPEGLCIYIAGGDEAAECLLTIGTPAGGGGEVHRRFSLTNSGVWLSASAWTNAQLSIESLGDTTGGRVGYVWTAQAPPTDNSGRLLYVQAVTVAAGIQRIPEGAAAVYGGVADAAWTWTTTASAGVPISLATGISAGGRTHVIGDYFTPGADNNLVWELWSP